MPTVRVRFAPSPTGHLHIGGGRTALYNYLFAKHHGGSFILRIEDTDRERSTDASTRGILEGLEWLGLRWDEGPVYQSASVEKHRDAARQLLAKGRAYHCYCSPEELEVMRNEATAKGEKPRYNGRCRELKAPPPGKENTPPVIRFKGPTTGSVDFTDLIRGQVSFACTELDDLILLRSDGSPTYNLTVVIDDVEMQITHVIRGDDHLNNTPRQIQLYEALEKPVPQFAHLSMILGPDKKKLSKRNGVPNILVYRDEGYLPEALCNYLVRLGWAHGDDEIFTMQQMQELFTLEAVGSSPAALNLEKLVWLNGHHMRQTPAAALWPLVKTLLVSKGIATFPDDAFCHRVVDSLKERTKTLVEMADLCLPYLREELVYDADACAKFLNAESKPLLQEITPLVSGLATWDVATLKETLEGWAEGKQLKFVKIAQPLRVALTGSSVSPGIFEVMELLGKTRSLKRLQEGIQRIP